LAGVLSAAGRHQQARQMYEGLKRTLADHYRLAEIDLAGKQYDSAEKEIRAILDARPQDLKARLLLAAVLSGRKEFAAAARLYEELARTNPGDTTIAVKLAELALWSGDYNTALARFQELLDHDVQQPALWRGYIDAAASATVLTETLPKTVRHIATQTRSGHVKDAVYLARMAWVLRRVKDLDRGIALLETALELDPSARDIRLQLAEALHEKGAYAQAEKHFQFLLRSRTGPPD
jgi:tetratricopeptide (TPR) repeat protein